MIFPPLNIHRRRARRFILGGKMYRSFTPTRNCAFTCLAVFDFLLFLGMFLLYSESPLALEPAVSEDDSPVTLLVWTHPFGQYSEPPDCLALYQIVGCTVSDDRSAYQQADAVIMHHRDIATGTGLPNKPRPGAQKWIWMNYESPSNTPNLTRFEGIFNLTLTYRTDSDIFLPYGYLVHRDLGTKGLQNTPGKPLSVPSPSHLLRPHLLAWIVSNWAESHKRVAFYHQLRRYVQVDVFGRAGRPLPKKSGGAVKLIGRYQFYLAFENSQHTDYITEKLWNAVLAGAIPVTLGPSRKNYERFLPPEAFIHVDDFPTVSELAQYLLTLRRNPAMLKSHLNWRSNYNLHQPSFWSEHYCMGCKVVRQTRGRTNVVKNLVRWFNS